MEGVRGSAGETVVGEASLALFTPRNLHASSNSSTYFPSGPKVVHHAVAPGQRRNLHRSFDP
jgi:hypothetical protein